MKNKKYYIAYGSNLNIEQMKFRCPTAKVAGISEIPDYRLLFKGSQTGAYLTIEPYKGASVPVAVWEVKEDDELFWYFVVRFLAATGARISELLQLKVEHIRRGYLDLYTKGGKLRRIYIPQALQQEAGKWLAGQKMTSGFVFLNRQGQRITARGVSAQLKKLAVRYGIDPDVVYPHSFRHRFAKSFLDRCGDIAFLADLMGHESIETTRIYLRKTATEQRAIVDRVVDW